MVNSDPSNATTIGFCDDWMMGMIASATDSVVNIGGGGRMTMTESTLESSNNSFKQAA